MNHFGRQNKKGLSLKCRLSIPFADAALPTELLWHIVFCSRLQHLQFLVFPRPYPLPT